VHFKGVRKLRRDLSQISFVERSYIVDAPSEPGAHSAETAESAKSKDQAIQFDIEATFREQYDRVARVIARVVRDPARAEELAVEVFLKLWTNKQAQGDRTQGWLYRVAVRMGLDELRRQTRRTRYERLLGFGDGVRTPEDIRRATEEQERVRLVLGVINRRHAELLLLRSDDFSYDEVASALDLNPASIGTLLSRAQQVFRKEYIKRYGEQ
jgi:RNA polymerase sigma-70 factor (ECF subfamily)